MVSAEFSPRFQRGSVANMEGGAFPESPLKPLRNRLCLIKALGLPLRIEDQEGTIVTNKSIWARIAILLLPFVFYAFGWFGSAFVLYSGEMRNLDMDMWIHNKGFRKWDITSTMMFSCIFMLLPFIYLYFYRGLGSKFEKFIQTYQRIVMNLNHGKEEATIVNYSK